MEYNKKHNKPIFQYNRSKKNEKKYKKTEKKRYFNLDEYIKFSGTEKKKFRN
jgi:hypothetical protein